MTTVLSVQSHVVHGYVGNKCAVFPLQLLGFEVDYVNSVQFTNHTGYPKFAGTVLRGPELDALVDGLEENGLLEHDSLLTGYIGSATFLRSVLRLVKKLRKKDGFQYFCDPVLGDNGKFYVPEDLVEIYRTEVLPVASVATPNQFEIETLTGHKIRSQDDAVVACGKLHQLGVPIVVITTLDYARSENKVVMMLSDGHSQFVVEVPLLEARFTGSGDLTAAMLLAWMRSHPYELPLALEKAAAVVFGVLVNTLNGRQVKDGVMPELNVIGSKAIIECPPLNFDARRNFVPVARFVKPPSITAVLYDATLESAAGVDESKAIFHGLPFGWYRSSSGGYSSLDAAVDALLTDEGHLLVVVSEPLPEQHPRCVTIFYLDDMDTTYNGDATEILGTVSDLRHLRRFFPSAE